MTIRARTKARVAVEPVDRIAAGRAAREAAPRSSHARLAAGARPPRPDRPPRGAGGARASPSWCRSATGACSSSPFTFYRGAAAIMAARPRRHARLGPARAGLRRRAPLELRHLRRAGAQARVRRQRLRRDAARTVGVGRQAPRGEHRDRRPRRRLRRKRAPRGSCSTPSRAYREAMREFADDGQPGRLVHAPRRRRAHPRVRQAARRKRARERRTNGRAKARTQDSLQALAKLDRASSTARRASSPTPR